MDEHDYKMLCLIGILLWAIMLIGLTVWHYEGVKDRLSFKTDTPLLMSMSGIGVVGGTIKNVDPVESESPMERIEEPVEHEPEVVMLTEEEIEAIEIEAFETHRDSATYYDVPLDEDLQDHIFALCKEYGVDPAVIIAMIGKESMYKADILGDQGRAFGLMQIHPRWHQERMDRLGCDNLLDPYQNVEVGIDLMSELMSWGKGLEWALMAYNGGYGHANRHVAAGTVSAYVEKVMECRDALETYVG